MGIITNNILLLLFLICSADAYKASVHSSSNSRCIESERKALLEFKASLVNGSSSLSFWTGRDCCSWDGISCHNLTGHIQSLQLDGYELNSTGLVHVSPELDQVSQIGDLGGSGPSGIKNSFNSTLSPLLFNLTHLQVLTVSSFALLGSIPTMFERLTSLTYLDLSRNSFDSAIFPDSLCSLTSLTHIALSETRLQGSLPSCLANMTSLTTLDVGGNKLSGEIPGWLGHLSNLTTLDLSYNHFSSSIPSTLGSLTKLSWFSVSNNFLTGELSELFFEELKSLMSLYISGNHHLIFNVNPQWIPPFQLSSIGMDSVLIGTQFPPWLQTQTNLSLLSMNNASISGPIPKWFPYVFRNLIQVDLSNNLLTGSIPDRGCQTTFPNLLYFDLSNNSLTGSIPNRCLTAFPKLFSIDLSNNFLTGSAPAFNCPYLLLSENQFSGNVPQALCNLTSLSYLSLGNNQLIGTIPPCLGALHLYVLDLGNNSLSGHIPHELGSLSGLNILHLNANNFSGELPPSLQNLTSLSTLDLGENEFQGSIPKWIGKKWSTFQYLRLESNNFSGEIPTNLCQLPSLQILNLALNNLVGTIPSCIGKSSKMLSEESSRTQFFVNYNGPFLNVIKGIELKYSSNLQYAKFISLSGNQLHGRIPAELMDLKGLQSLNLSNNELTGSIPETINNLKNLESLDLSLNRLSGPIPQSLANIDALGYLNLSFNNLVGKVPSGNHFDTLDDPSIYQGNGELCGKILMKSCPGDNSATSNQPNVLVHDDDEFDQLSWMYAGIGPGYAVGFLAMICTLYFKHPWRIIVFGFADKVYHKVWVTFTIKLS